MTSFVKTLAQSTVALCVLFAVAFAQPQPQPRPKAAVYIMGSPEGRDVLRSAVNTVLIKSGKYQMIAVDAIDVVAQEQRRQMSGSVSDGDIAKLGRDAGAEYVCVVQRSELDGVSYVAIRMVSVQSKVAELAEMVKLPPGGDIIELTQWQIGSMLGMQVGPRPGTGTQTGTQRSKEEILADIQRLEQQKRTEQSGGGATGGTELPMRGTNVPGGSLAQKLAWLQKSADSHETYIIEVSADETIAPNNRLEYSGAINITIVMRGVGGNRTIKLSSHGTMFIVKTEVTLVLENNITLRGHNGNNGRIISVEGGKLKMNAGTSIINNTGGGVSVGEGGTFDMSGGTISGNGGKDIKGGGVSIGMRGGTFTMAGGTISGNTATDGGGVFVEMSIAVSNNNIFTVTGGTIFGNTASKGGGIYLSFGVIARPAGVLNIRGGTISGNTATEYGGGLYAGGAFTKTGGTITGYKSDPTNGNVVKDEDGNIIARKGHAVYIEDNKRKETTAGPGANFKDGAGPWDQ
jgi:hypothetical protein